MRLPLPTLVLLLLPVVFVQCTDPPEPIDYEAEIRNTKTALRSVYLDDYKADYFASGRIAVFRQNEEETAALYNEGSIEEAAARYEDLLKEATAIEQWVRSSVWTYESESKNADHGTALELYDGGVALIGRASTTGRGNDGFLTLLNSEGEEHTRQHYGGKDNDELRRVRKTPDGGFILVGRTSSFGDFSGDLFLVKTDGDGNEEWAKSFGKTGTDSGVDALSLDDGGYLVFGQTFQGGEGMNLYLIRVDADGTALWEKSIGGEGDQFATSVVPLGNNRYAVAGVNGTLNENDGQPILFIIDGEGVELDRFPLEAPGFVNPDSVTVIETDSGFALTAGFLTKDRHVRTWSGRNPAEDILVLSLDRDGKIEWSETFGGEHWDSPRGIVQMKDGGYTVLAASKSYSPGDIEYVLIRVDSKGNQRWMRSYGLDGNDTVSALNLDPHDGLLVVGCLRSTDDRFDAAFVMHTDPNGRAWLDDAPFGTLDPEPETGEETHPGSESAPPSSLPPIGIATPIIEAKQWINTEQEVSLKALLGKIVVLEFWATWCAPCKTSIPHLVEIQKKYRDDGVVVVSLTDEDREAANIDAFMAEMKMDYIVGTGSNTLNDYGVTGIPTAFIIDRQGILRWSGHPMDDLDARVAQALAAAQ